MKDFTNPLANVEVASPCPANWNEMLGDERKRYCSECRLNVYNLSDMTRREAENFLINAEGRVCVKFYRREDGSVLTKDCPVGWQAAKRRVSRTAKAFASLCAGIFGGIFAFNQFQPTPENVRGDDSVKVSPIDANLSPNKIEDFPNFSDPAVRSDEPASHKYPDFKGRVGQLVRTPPEDTNKINSKNQRRR
jgi:hypothetical protein